VKVADGKIFDVALAPMFLLLFGIPALLIAAIGILIAVTVRLAKRARIKNAETEEKPGNGDSSEGNQ